MLQLSDELTRDDCKKIVFLEDLPKQLEDKSPLAVVTHLEMLGKTSKVDLIRILKCIGRQELAKKARDVIKRKDTELSMPKLEEQVALAAKNCEVLQEQLEYLKIAAGKRRRKRIAEVVSEAKTNLANHMQRKLSYISGLLRAESEDQSQSPPSSPENGRSELPPRPENHGAGAVQIIGKTEGSQRSLEKQTKIGKNNTLLAINVMIEEKYLL